MASSFGFDIGPRFQHDYLALNIVLLCSAGLGLVVCTIALFSRRQKLYAYHSRLSEYYGSRDQYMQHSSNDGAAPPTRKRDIIPTAKMHVPALSWMIAFLIFAIFWFISFGLGSVHELFYWLVLSGDVTHGHSDNNAFIIWTSLSCVMELVLYWWLWTRWTITYNREKHSLLALGFGFIWGLSVSQMLVSIYRLFRAIEAVRSRQWLLAILTFVGWSLFQPVFDEVIWNKYVMPTHDNQWSLMIKPLVIHIPNTLVTLSYLVYYDNIVFFTVFQTLVLMADAGIKHFKHIK